MTDIFKRLSKYRVFNSLPLIRAEDLMRCKDKGHFFLSVLTSDVIPDGYFNDQDVADEQVRRGYKPLRYRGRRFFELNDSLDQLQEDLFRILFKDAPVSDIVHGYLRKRSIFTNFDVHHRGNPKTQLKIDLIRAFDQINSERLRQFLTNHWSFDRLKELLKKRAEWFDSPKDPTFRWWAFSDWQGYKEFLDIIEFRFDEKWYQCFLEQVVKIFLYPHLNGKHYLPQGATISPWLFNVMLYELDEELKKLVEPYGYRITRFGDDIAITTSNDYIPQELVDNIFAKIAEFDFRINWRKTEIRHLAPDSPLLFPGIILHYDGHVRANQRSRSRMRLRLVKTRGGSQLEAIQGGINGYLKRVSRLSQVKNT